MSAIQKLLTDHIDIWTAAETEKKSGRGRASGNAGSVYGIKKLRELILELAVRGKLVPQDDNDEPASELLKRIQAEKAKLIAEGKIKKDKPLAAITEDEKPFELPNGWEWVRFGNIAQHNSGKTLDSGRNSGELHDYITTSNLYWGRFDLSNVRQMPFRIDEFEKCLARKGDLLICEGGEAGRAAVWFYEKDICFQNHVHRARFYGGIDPYFAYRFFEKLNATGEIDLHRKGVGISNMSGKALSLIVFPLPPLAEQHRIVAKVDELMALCDQLENQHSNAAEAHEKLVSHLLGTLTQSQNAEDFSANWQRIAAHFDTLFTTDASIDALKQTLLQLAVMGKLVPQDENDESASELLKRIQAEKAKLIAAGTIMNNKPLPPITDDEKQFVLPNGWKWVRFSDYAIDIATGPFGSMIHQSDYVQGGVPLINPSHMISDKIFADKAVTVSKEMAKTLDSYAIYDGDIVMARRGEVGRIALVTNAENGWLCGTGSFVLRFCAEVCRDYLRMFFRCDYTRTYLAGEAVGTTMVNLNHGILKKLPVGLPPLAEQHRIVAKVDELMVLCDQLKSRIVDASRMQQKLADVLVEQAVA